MDARTKDFLKETIADHLYEMIKDGDFEAQEVVDFFINGEDTEFILFMNYIGYNLKNSTLEET